MLPLQWRQGPEISRRETASPSRLHQCLLNHQRVHVHETHLKQVQRQHQYLLVLPPVAGELSTLSVEDEIVGTVVELHLNRRMQSFTAFKSWTGNVFSAFNSWKELHLNRRQRRSFGSEISSAEIIGADRYILRKRGLPAAILVTKSRVKSFHELSAVFYDLSTTITAFKSWIPLESLSTI